MYIFYYSIIPILMYMYISYILSYTEYVQHIKLVSHGVCSTELSSLAQEQS